MKSIFLLTAIVLLVKPCFAVSDNCDSLHESTLAPVTYSDEVSFDAMAIAFFTDSFGPINAGGNWTYFSCGSYDRTIFYIIDWKTRAIHRYTLIDRIYVDDYLGAVLCIDSDLAYKKPQKYYECPGKQIFKTTYHLTEKIRPFTKKCEEGTVKGRLSKEIISEEHGRVLAGNPRFVPFDIDENRDNIIWQMLMSSGDQRIVQNRGNILRLLVSIREDIKEQIRYLLRTKGIEVSEDIIDQSRIIIFGSILYRSVGWGDIDILFVLPRSYNGVDFKCDFQILPSSCSEFMLPTYIGIVCDENTYVNDVVFQMRSVDFRKMIVNDPQHDWAMIRDDAILLKNAKELLRKARVYYDHYMSRELCSVNHEFVLKIFSLCFQSMIVLDRYVELTGGDKSLMDDILHEYFGGSLSDFFSRHLFFNNIPYEANIMGLEDEHDRSLKIEEFILKIEETINTIERDRILAPETSGANVGKVVPVFGDKEIPASA